MRRTLLQINGQRTMGILIELRMKSIQRPCRNNQVMTTIPLLFTEWKQMPQSDREDRASVAELLLSGYEAYLVRDDSDEVLNQKVAAIKELYFNLSSGLMDDHYWEDLRFTSKFSPTAAEFGQKAHGIIETPYEEYIYKDKVSKAVYTNWQNRLKIEYPIRPE